MASFSNLKTLRAVRQWWSSFSVLKALKPLERDRNSFFFSGHALLSFHIMIKFPGATFSLSVPTEFI